jgi:hypothetical protein
MRPLGLMLAVSMMALALLHPPAAGEKGSQRSAEGDCTREVERRGFTVLSTANFQQSRDGWQVDVKARDHRGKVTDGTCFVETRTGDVSLYGFGWGGGGTVDTAAPISGDGSGGDPVTLLSSSTAGQVLTSNGTGVAPTWQDVGAFAPDDISDLALWLDASDAATINGGNPSDDDPVGVWADKSGNAYDAVQTEAENRPVYKTGVQNGLAGVRVDPIVMDHDDQGVVAFRFDFVPGAGDGAAAANSGRSSPSSAWRKSSHAVPELPPGATRIVSGTNLMTP